MNNLENLMPITFTEDNESYVSLRDLHDFLQIEINFRLWFPQICEYGFVEGEDYTVVYQKDSLGNLTDTVSDYMISLEMAKEVAVIEKSVNSREARSYFIEKGRRFKNAKVALMSLTSSEDEIISSSETLSNSSNETLNNSNSNTTSSPTNNYKKVKSLASSDVATDLKTNFRDTSKLFGIRENLFVNWLILNKYIYRDSRGELKPYAKVMNYFNMRTYATTSGHAGVQTLINTEGREAFRNLLINEEIIKEEVKF
ncbi:antA/AntB antirepressor family protein [Terrisporobacter sp.]